MAVIYYVYPQHHDVSFKFVAVQHIKMLREKYTVYEIPALNFYQFTPYGNPISIIHPFFYSMWRWGKIEFTFFEMYKSKVKKIIGVEVADSDRISEKYINYANNYADSIIVNSQWSKNAFVNSGLKIPIFVVPHNFNERLLANDKDLKPENEILYVEKMKNEKKFKLITYFVWHSDYRKGADIFHEIAKRIQKERNDVYFLVKSGGARTDFVDLRLFNLTGTMKFDSIVKIYRISDLLLLPSRGGSFELNCLEALVSGIPCIATEGGAWDEFFPQSLRHLLVKSVNSPIVLPNNDIHIGKGVEMDIDEATEKILKILNNIDEEKEKVKGEREFYIKNYSFNAVKQKLFKAI